MTNCPSYLPRISTVLPLAALVFALVPSAALADNCETTLDLMHSNIDVIINQQTEEANESFWVEREACYAEEDRLRDEALEAYKFASYWAQSPPLFGGPESSGLPTLVNLGLAYYQYELALQEAEDVFFDCYEPAEEAFHTELDAIDDHRDQLEIAARDWHSNCLIEADVANTGGW